MAYMGVLIFLIVITAIARGNDRVYVLGAQVCSN